jgi:tetratricopeptide (TPR) repeat protein
VKKLYDQREVSRLIGISESQIRYWDRQGLIPHQEKRKGLLCFDFQGLVAFRTVKELRQQGVSLRKIRKCVEHVKRTMPEIARPLSEGRLSLVDDQLVYGKNRRRFTPEGQLLMDFSGEEQVAVTASLEITEELFFQALEDEADGRREEAIKKYEAILAKEPDLVDALVNLGNILFLSGSRGLASAHYRRALSLNPDHVEANYNFANLLDSQGEVDMAVLFYRKALHEDPDFGDAHFNLATALNQLGDFQGARVHWRRYLELEPESEWAVYIKKLLDEE